VATKYTFDIVNKYNDGHTYGGGYKTQTSEEGSPADPNLDTWWQEIVDTASSDNLEDVLRYMYVSSYYNHWVAGDKELWTLYLNRGFCSFDTTVVPVGSTIHSLSLYLYLYGISKHSPYPDLIVQKLNVSDRLNFVATDLAKANHSGNYASKSFNSLAQENNLPITDFSLINKGAYTLLVLKTDMDLNESRPTVVGTNTAQLSYNYYGREIPVFTIEVSGWEIETNEATDIGLDFFTGNGTIENDTDGTISRRGFQISNDRNDPDNGYFKNVYEDGNFAEGSFSLDIEDIGAYYGKALCYRAYIKLAGRYYYGDWVNVDLLEISVTTEAVTQITDYMCAMGNGTIVAGTNITERGFEVKTELLSYFGVGGDIWWFMLGFNDDSLLEYGVPIAGRRTGYLIKKETWTGDFETGAYEGVLGKATIFGNPGHSYNDALKKGYSYKCRAYMVADGETYYGDWVDFDSPAEPIIEPIIEPISPEEVEVLLEWEWPEIVFPPWEWPEFNIPPWQWPFYDIPPFDFDPSIVFGSRFGAFLRRQDTKKDWETLREKCIIYQENMNQFTLTVNHNTLVMKNLINDIITYVDGDVYPSDLKLMNSSQQLTPLYNEEISPDGFKDIINDFRFKDVSNTYDLTINFKKILNSLNSLNESDYTTEPMSYNTLEYMDIQPTAKRMISQLEDMRKKSGEVRRLVVKNFKRIFTYV